MSVFQFARTFLKSRLNDEQKRRWRAVFGPWLAWWYRRDLKALAGIYGSDKWNDHWYAQHYERFLGEMRGQPVRVLEIGIGGYDDPQKGGSSLRMWKSYFPRGLIHGLDLHDKSGLEESRIKIFQGSQADLDVLKRVEKEAGPFDIIIDDGSHLNEHVPVTFKALFPGLKEGGLYFVEDTQTSYWPDFGGNPDPTAKGTMMTYFKDLCDAVNSSEYKGSGVLEQSIYAMHFYHNLIVIEKDAPNRK